jgi:hypothetical protein
MMMRRRFTVGFVSCLGAVLVVGLLVGTIPVTGFEGIDGRIIVHRMPLWEKVARFYLRHVEFERWAREAAGGETDPQRRVLKLMDWTIKNVRHITPDLPLIDDHISHIVLRRYGNDGQLAEVFTALTTYTGNQGRWEAYRPPGARERVVLSFVESDSGWWVFDLWNGGWFETHAGQIATIHDFRHPEQLRRQGQAPEVLNGTPYLDYFKDLNRVWKRSFSRARGQMPWHRLLMELRLEPDDGDWSPPDAS